jgi:hypothetical protein
MEGRKTSGAASQATRDCRERELLSSPAQKNEAPKAHWRHRRISLVFIEKQAQESKSCKVFSGVIGDGL